MKKIALNLFLFFLSIFIAFFIGEVLARRYYKISSPNTLYNFQIKKTSLNSYSKTFGITLDARDSAYFIMNPAPRTYGTSRTELYELDHLEHLDWKDNLYKQWNYNYLKHKYNKETGKFSFPDISGYKHLIYAFKPYDSSEFPRYRFFTNSTYPGNPLHTNQFGFGGSDISFKKPANTLRIAFLGASTTQQLDSFAYPDYVEMWLNKWAKEKNYNLNFEVLNTGRVALTSSDLKSILQYEILPLAPDIVVYYEGRNQFDMESVVGFSTYNNNESFLYKVCSKSVVVQLLLQRCNISIYRLVEDSKNSYSLNIPKSIDQENPNLQADELPVNLPVILKDLDSMVMLCKNNRVKFVISSYAMMLEDSILAQVEYNHISSYWLHDFGRVKTKDIKTLINLENRAFRKFAQNKKIDFLDLSPLLLQHPEAFQDGIHLNKWGIRLHGWFVYKELAAIIERDIESEHFHINETPDGLFSHPNIRDSFISIHLPLRFFPEI